MDKKLYTTFAENLKKWLQRREKSQIELANYMHVSAPTVSDWVNGKKMPRADKLQSIANWLVIDLSDLLLKESDSSGSVKMKVTVTAVRIPVLGRVAAGIPIEAISDTDEWEGITSEMASRGEYFGLRIKGDSMEPKISDGDIVIVRQQPNAENGDLVIAYVNGYDAVCKRLKIYQDGIALVSNNPSYPPMYFSNEEMEQTPVVIVGKVVELRAKF